MDKCTKGIWWSGESLGCEASIFSELDGKLIIIGTTVVPSKFNERPLEQKIADAQLMAASKELYETTKMLLYELRTATALLNLSNTPEVKRIFEKAELCIKKANGETKYQPCDTK